MQVLYKHGNLYLQQKKWYALHINILKRICSTFRSFRNLHKLSLNQQTQYSIIISHNCSILLDSSSCALITVMKYNKYIWTIFQKHTTQAIPKHKELEELRMHILNTLWHTFGHLDEYFSRPSGWSHTYDNILPTNTTQVA